MFGECDSLKGLPQFPLSFKLLGLDMYAYFHAGRTQRSQWSPFRRALLRNFFLLTIAVMTVLCLVTGIKPGGTCFPADFKVQLLKLKKAIGRLTSEIQCFNVPF